MQESLLLIKTAQYYKTFFTGDANDSKSRTVKANFEIQPVPLS